MTGNLTTYEFDELSESETLVRDVGGREFLLIGTRAIRDELDPGSIGQAFNALSAPGVCELALNPDAHFGYGAPIGCVLASPSHIYPGPVGVDIKCSMSLLALDLPVDALDDRRTRRAVIDAILERIPTGPGKGQRSVKKSRPVDRATGVLAVTEGASRPVCEKLAIPFEWAQRCEDAFHRGHDRTADSLRARITRHLATGAFTNFDEKIRQLGSYGGGNHFGELEAVEIEKTDFAKKRAGVFGLRDGHAAFFSHCGSRGFGYVLANTHFKRLKDKFRKGKIPFPGGDSQLVYAELGSHDADDYLDDMALAANFATVNHLLINSLVLEAFREVFGAVGGTLVYMISHNIARHETVRGRPVWVHRKGATRAFPAGHPELAGTVFAKTGHPILLPGNPRDGSVVMAGLPGAEKTMFSVNHGAGRRMGRKAALRALDQQEIDGALDRADILTNCRNYPRDEAPDAYKDFDAVLRSVRLAGLADTVAKLHARFVVKDADKSNRGLA